MKSNIDLAIRLYIAAIFLVYGIAKAYNIQFEQSNLIDINKLSTGKEIVWFFYSYSYSYSLIIGIFQIIGALFLILNRTKFLGYIILLPIIINIVLLNCFFKIEAIKEAIFCLILICLSLCFNLDILRRIIPQFFLIIPFKLNFIIIITVLILLLIMGRFL